MSVNIWATCVRKFAPRNFQKLAYIVTPITTGSCQLKKKCNLLFAPKVQKCLFFAWKIVYRWRFILTNKFRISIVAAFKAFINSIGWLVVGRSKYSFSPNMIITHSGKQASKLM